MTARRDALSAHAIPAEECRLIERVRGGDVDAFDGIVRSHGAELCSLAFRYTRSRAVAEELVQDVFLHVWINRRRWAVRRDMASYLHAAARNRALNYLRSRKFELPWHGHDGRDDTPFDDVVDPGATADLRTESAELADAARRAIDALPERCRIAFLLVRDRHLSYAETARVMGTSIHTVNVQIGRAIKALRYRLAAYLPDPRPPRSP